MKTFRAFITEDDAPPRWSGAISMTPIGPLSSSKTRIPRKPKKNPIPLDEPVHTPMGKDPNRRDPLP